MNIFHAGKSLFLRSRHSYSRQADQFSMYIFLFLFSNFIVIKILLPSYGDDITPNENGHLQLSKALLVMLFFQLVPERSIFELIWP